MTDTLLCLGQRSGLNVIQYDACMCHKLKISDLCPEHASLLEYNELSRKIQWLVSCSQKRLT